MNKENNNNDPILLMIENYKKHIAQTQLKDEVYKWELIEKYKGRPNLDADDLLQEIKSVGYGNLMYAMGKAVLNRLANERTEGLRELLENLFDESKDLTERVKAFNKQSLKLYRELESKLGHHQDERSISAYLTLRNPEKYTFYKYAFYNNYCKLLGIKQAKKNERYTHYITLIDELIENYIISDKELIELVKSYIPQYYDGSNHKLLAQDILYQMLDKNAEMPDSTTSKSNEQLYWLYSPGENAQNWEEFYNDGIMAIGWDKIGDIRQYTNRKQIKKALVDKYGGEGSKKNDVSANDDFLNKMKVGDVIIVKKGRSELLGYGIVTSDYIYDDAREENINLREVDWKLRGRWEINHPMITKTLTDITTYATDDPNYDTYYERLLGIMKEEMSEKITTSKMNYPLNTIFYGPPGTGKTYNTVLRAAEIIEDRKIEDYDEAIKIFNDNRHKQLEFITFHQNYSYEDFIQGIRPDTDDNEVLTFEKRDGIFKKIADRALKNLKESEAPTIPKKSFEDAFNQFIFPLAEGEVEEIEVKMTRVSYYITAVTDKSIDFRKASGGTAHTLSITTLNRMYDAESVLEIRGLTSYYAPLLKELLKIGKDSSSRKEVVEKKNYVIIIDEINRANISRVFGELITLIEVDKRSHGQIPLETKLPSGDKFMVPSNLYIIGTMNTADKSIALLDIALRRRFEFEAMYPLYDIKDKTINDAEILKKLNDRIIETKGHDFQIGHSFFMGSNGDTYDLNKTMNNKVIPLLLEYYMNDEKEVKGILLAAGLTIEENAWPLRITGKNDKSI